MYTCNIYRLDAHSGPLNTPTQRGQPASVAPTMDFVVHSSNGRTSSWISCFVAFFVWKGECYVCNISQFCILVYQYWMNKFSQCGRWRERSWYGIIHFKHCLGSVVSHSELKTIGARRACDEPLWIGWLYTLYIPAYWYIRDRGLRGPTPIRLRVRTSPGCQVRWHWPRSIGVAYRP